VEKQEVKEEGEVVVVGVMGKRVYVENPVLVEGEDEVVVVLEVVGEEEAVVRAEAAVVVEEVGEGEERTKVVEDIRMLRGREGTIKRCLGWVRFRLEGGMGQYKIQHNDHFSIISHTIPSVMQFSTCTLRRKGIRVYLYMQMIHPTILPKPTD
jgi:hypothetical protein